MNTTDPDAIEDLQSMGIDSCKDITEMTVVFSGYDRDSVMYDAMPIFTTDTVTVDADYIAQNYVSATQLENEQ